MKYDWKRYWVPRDGNYVLDDDGYLLDPESEYSQYYNTAAVSVDELQNFQVLVLLGEPGMGKSSTIESETDRIEKQLSAQGDQVLSRKLITYNTDAYLVKDLFESDEFTSFSTNQHRLYVFLDGLDECRIKIPTVSSLLVQRLKKVPRERLFIRLTCRSGVSLSVLEENLIQLWGKDSVGIFELIPLRRKDVEMAANVEGLDVTAFMSEIQRCNAAPFANRPITLRMLFDLFRREKALPTNRKDLYQKGCLYLCEEHNPDRRDTGHVDFTGSYSPAQRLIMASRIAAATILSNRGAVWIGREGDAASGDVSPSELCGGEENADGMQFQVDHPGLKEVLLDTGLFNSRGQDRVGWAHQTYAEFLAAWYLVEQELDIGQMLNLLRHSSDFEGKIAPQLIEVLAWLCEMNREVFTHVLQTEPDILLRCDIAFLPDENKSGLVAELLRRYDAEKLFDTDWNMRKQYRKLKHAGLAGQLLPYIGDRTKGFVVRRVAIGIAEACDVRETIDMLVRIVLDSSEVITIREQACHAIACIGDAEARSALRPLVLEGISEDIYDNLKCAALRAVWPGHLSAEELFGHIEPPRKNNFSGAYTVFLRSELADGLQPTDIPQALAWVGRQGTVYKLNYDMQALVGAIMRKAWEYLDHPGNLEPFARTAWGMLKNHDRLFESNRQSSNGLLAADDNKRRRLLAAIVPLLANPDRDTLTLAFACDGFVRSNDIPWLLECCRTAVNELEHRVLAHLVNRLVSWHFTNIDDVLEACAGDAILSETLDWLVKPCFLDNPEAIKAKDEYYERLAFEEEHKPKPLIPPPAERVALALNASEAGDTKAWVDLVEGLALEETDCSGAFVQFGVDITALPGWQKADDSTRPRIVEAAKRHILQQQPDTWSLFGANSYDLPMVIGLHALCLLVRQEPLFLESLTRDNWHVWAPLIIWHHVDNETRDIRERLLRLAYDAAPDEILAAISAQADKEINQQDGNVNVVFDIEIIWDARIEGLLADKLSYVALDRPGLWDLLDKLVRRNNKAATTFALKLLQELPPEEKLEYEYALKAAVSLTLWQPRLCWQQIWQTVQSNIEFGRELILRLAQKAHREGAIFNQLTADEIGDLYLWLDKELKTESESSIDDVSLLKNGLIRALEKAGTEDACRTLERVVAEYPNRTSLKWILNEAWKNTRRATWQPPSPRDVLKVTANPEARLVRSGEELLDAVIASLHRLQAKLRGATPLTPFLWDEHSGRSKSEPRLSDFVKNHLHDDLMTSGVIVNREVEVQNLKDRGIGERTDILVDTFIRDTKGLPVEHLSVVIETKGCWNEGLLTAMQTQLKDDYLLDAGLRYGLYLVGWFGFEHWTDEDRRKRECRKLDLVGLKEVLNTKAVELSDERCHIRAFVLDASLEEGQLAP